MGKKKQQVDVDDIREGTSTVADFKKHTVTFNFSLGEPTALMCISSIDGGWTPFLIPYDDIEASTFAIYFAYMYYLALKRNHQKWEKENEAVKELS